MMPQNQAKALKQQLHMLLQANLAMTSLQSSGFAPVLMLQLRQDQRHLISIFSNIQ